MAFFVGYNNRDEDLPHVEPDDWILLREQGRRRDQQDEVTDRQAAIVA